MGVLLKILFTFTLLAAPATAGAAGLIKPVNNIGLLSYWAFNEGSGSQAFDSSGNGNTGTLNGSPTRTTGKSGGGISFTSSTHNVSGTVAASATAYTVSAWIKYQGSVPISAIKVAVSFGPGGADNTLWMGYASDGRLAVSDSQVDIKSSTVQSSNEWQHVVGVVSSGTLTAYANGVSIGTTAMSSRGSNALMVGNYPTASSLFFNGVVDEVKVFNRALTEPEVAALYRGGSTVVKQSLNEITVNSSSARLTTGSTLTNGLVGHWTFDGPDTVSTIADRSGLANNGYFAGGATSSAKVAGKMGQALSFNGNGQYVSAPGTYPTGTNPRTLCGWVKSDDLTFEGNADHVLNYGTANTNQAFGFMIHTGNQWRFFGFGGAVDFDTGVAVDTNWHHHCLTYDGTTVTYYYDGASVASQARTLSTTGGGMTLATRPDLTVSDSFNGKIDDVRIYNRSLSTSEIKQLYLIGK